MKFLQEPLKVEVNADGNVMTALNVFLLNGGKNRIHIQISVLIIAKYLRRVHLNIQLQQELRIGVLCMSKVYLKGY